MITAVGHRNTCKQTTLPHLKQTAPPHVLAHAIRHTRTKAM